MTKKICLTVLAILLTFCFTTAQQNRKVTKEQLAKVTSDTLFVVFDDNLMAYNVSVKAAIEKNWTRTPYKCIPYATFDQVRQDKNKLFLLLTRTTMTKDKRDIEYQFMNFLLGDSVEAVNDLPEILTLPLAFTGSDDAKYAGKLPAFVRFAQQHITSMMEAKFLFGYFNFKVYNGNIPTIKTKTLLVTAADLSDDANTLEKIKAQYPYEVKIVSDEEMDKAIEQKKPNTLFLFIVYPGEDNAFGRNYKMILGADDSQLYYYYFLTVYEQQPAGFTAKDFRRITGKL